MADREFPQAWRDRVTEAIAVRRPGLTSDERAVNVLEALAEIGALPARSAAGRAELRRRIVARLGSDEWMDRHFGISAHAGDIADAVLEIWPAVEPPADALEAAQAAAVASWHVMDTSGHRQAVEAAVRAAAPHIRAQAAAEIREAMLPGRVSDRPLSSLPTGTRLVEAAARIAGGNDHA